MTENPPCPQCGNPVGPSRSTNGRPKIYCSPRCGWQAANARKRGAPRPDARTRRPLPAFAKDAGWTLRKDVERIERIFADDRFTLYKQQVALHLQGHLTYAAEVCQTLLSQLNETGD